MCLFYIWSSETSLSGVVECFCLEITLRSPLIYIRGWKGFVAVTPNKTQLVTSQSFTTAEEKLHTERLLTDRLFNRTGSSQKAVRSVAQLKMQCLLGPDKSWETGRAHGSFPSLPQVQGRAPRGAQPFLLVQLPQGWISLECQSCCSGGTELGWKGVQGAHSWSVSQRVNW